MQSRSDMEISRRGAMPSTVIGIILMASLMCAHATGILIDARQPSDPIGPYEYGTPERGSIG
jgi:hypothetical protein